MNINTEEIIKLVYETKSLIMDTVNAQNIIVKGPADFVTAIDPEKPAWILDPIDGTTNLIYDFHHSAVSLGYYE